MAERERSFLCFLLQGSNKQVKFILQNITPSQLISISEICYNLKYSVIEKPLLDRIYKYRSLIKILGDTKSNYKSRRALVVKNPFKIVYIVKTTEELWS